MTRPRGDKENSGRGVPQLREGRRETCKAYRSGPDHSALWLSVLLMALALLLLGSHVAQAD